jgi:ATP-dependent DNA helicase RecG
MHPQSAQNKVIKKTLNEGLNKTLNVLLNKTLNEGLNEILATVASKPGIQANALSVLLNNRPIKTIERQIKELTTANLIERKGSKKTGGYFLVKK